MPTRDALLAEIREHPDDDAPRLVFADWLEEHGDEKDRAHAELIRVQIELARLPLDDDRRAELRVREGQLRYRPAILERLGLPRWVGGYVRGFPERLGYWLQQAQPSDADLALMAEAIERLPIRTFAHELTGESIERFAGWPSLARLTSLEATTGLDHFGEDDCRAGLLALARSPYAANLRRLRLGAWQYDEGTLAAIASSPHLARLVDLDLSGHTYETTHPALVALTQSPLAERLERLDLAWVDVPPILVRSFLGRGRLRELHFGVPSEEDEGDEGVGPLLWTQPGLSRLRLLDITGEEHGFYVDELPDDRDHRFVSNLWSLLASPHLAGLEGLSLRGIALDDEGAHILADSPMARNLVALRLGVCRLTGDGLRALRPLLAEGRLRQLSLGHNVFTTEDALDLASWPELGRLHELSLGYFNHIDDEGRRALETSPHRHPYLRFE